MSNYAGGDDLVGTLIAQALGTQLPVVYWQDFKTIDVQRAINTCALWIKGETTEYLGFGNQSFKDVEVASTIFMYQFNPSGLNDEATLQSFVSAIHVAMNAYNNSGQVDTVAGSPVVWVKTMAERREDAVRGVILYEITYQVRVILTTQSQAAGATSTSLPQLMLNFLSGLPAPSAGGTWTAVAASTLKTIDTNRTGDVVAVHAPVASGRPIGLGEGLNAGGQANTQQMSDYTFKLTLYASVEVDLVSATDWITSQCVTYFLNLGYTNGNCVLAKKESVEEIVNLRGVWERDVVLKITCVVNP